MNSSGVPDMAPVPRTRMSATAITGFIFGLLFCLPVVSGLAGILFSALGLRATRDPLVKGRGLAIAGLILGILSLCGWLCMGGVVGALFWSTAAPRAVMQDVTAKISSGDLTGAAALCDTSITPTELENLQTKFSTYGTFEGMTSWGTSINTVNGVGNCTLTGTIRFSGGTHVFEAELKRDGGPWKLERFEIRR